MKNRYVLSVLVTNESGVLTRLSGLFSRRGFNIDSLTVSETADESLSRITIVLHGDDYILNQITMQLSKLHDVKKVVHLKNDYSIYRELMLIKVKSVHETRSDIIEMVNVFRAKILDFASEALTIEITGDTNKNNAFLDLLKPYGVLEIARTGLTALERGNKNIYEYEKFMKESD